MDKKFWLKLDKNKIILQLRDLGKRFSLRRGSSRRSFLIIFLFFVLVGAGAAIYRYNYGTEGEENNGISIELNEVIDSSGGIRDEEGKIGDLANTGEQTPGGDMTVSGETGADRAAFSPVEEREFPADKEAGAGETRQTAEGGAAETGSAGKTVNTASAGKAVERGSEEKAAGVVTEPLRPVMQEGVRAFTLLKPVTGELLREPGWYYHPVLEDWRYNHGIEFSGNTGDVVMAAADGRVSSIEEDAYQGILVLVNHENGWQTEYGHLQRAAVSPGQVVARGQEIGRLGETGVSYEPSLYFALKSTDSMIDPLEFFE